jgi:hypothetical protein
MDGQEKERLKVGEHSSESRESAYAGGEGEKGKRQCGKGKREKRRQSDSVTDGENESRQT